jgi:hypothetical protein
MQVPTWFFPSGAKWIKGCAGIPSNRVERRHFRGRFLNGKFFAIRIMLISIRE